MSKEDDRSIPGNGDALSGIQPERVIEALRARRHNGNSRADGRTIALVVEGGSMRGVYSAGGMLALARLGYTNTFDRIYATSAGALNAGYFLSHQPDLGISVYFDSLPTRRFLNPFRWWKIIDIDWLFDHILTSEKPLDVATVMNSPTRLLVTVMDRNGVVYMIDAQRSPTPLLGILKASVAAPVFYNRWIEVEGRLCMDGGLGHRVPLEPAILDGCTDILVLTTQPAGETDGHTGWFSSRIFNLLCARGSAPLNAVFADHAQRARAVRCLQSDVIYEARQRVNIAVLRPPDGAVSAWATGRRSMLIRGAGQYEAMVNALFADP